MESNSKWEADPLLKKGITLHPRIKDKVVCRLCQKKFRAYKSVLQNHVNTLKHKQNFRAGATPEEYNQFVMALNDLMKDVQQRIRKEVAKDNVDNCISNKPSVGRLATPSDGRDVDGPSNSGIQVGQPSDNNDIYYMSAESPSDFDSIILEEQAPSSPHGNHSSNESVASVRFTHSSLPRLPLTYQDVINAIEGNNFTLSDLVSLGKAVLRKIELSISMILQQLSDINTTASIFSSFPLNVSNGPGNAKRRRKRARNDEGDGMDF